MLVFQFLQGLILLSASFGPAHAKISLCDGKETAPIAINFGIDAITVVSADSPKEFHPLIAPIATWDEEHWHSLENYRRALIKARSNYAYRVQPNQYYGPSLIDEITVTVSDWCDEFWSWAGNLVGFSESQKENHSFRPICSWIPSISEFIFPSSLREHLRRAMKPEELSPVEFKTAFLEAFRVLQNASVTAIGVNITSAVILYPDFLDGEVPKICCLIKEAARENGIIPYDSDQATPRGPLSMIASHCHILDKDMALPEILENPEIVEKPQPACDQRIFLIDHGLWHFGIHLSNMGRWASVPAGYLSTYHIVIQLMNKIVASNETLEKKFKTNLVLSESLFSAVVQARKEMKEQLGSETWEEAPEENQIKEWPIKPEAWPNDDEYGDYNNTSLHVLLSDVKDIETEYMDHLKANLTGFFKEPAIGEDGDRSRRYTIDKVIILGNPWDGSLIRRAIQDMASIKVEIIGGAVEEDITLEAQGGAKMAWQSYSFKRAVDQACIAIERNMEEYGEDIPNDVWDNFALEMYGQQEHWNYVSTSTTSSSSDRRMASTLTTSTTTSSITSSAT